MPPSMPPIFFCDFGVDFFHGVVAGGEHQVLQHFGVARSFGIDGHGEHILVAVHFDADHAAAGGAVDADQGDLGLHSPASSGPAASSPACYRAFSFVPGLLQVADGPDFAAEEFAKFLHFRVRQSAFVTSSAWFVPACGGPARRRLSTSPNTTLKRCWGAPNCLRAVRISSARDPSETASRSDDEFVIDDGGVGLCDGIGGEFQAGSDHGAVQSRAPVAGGCGYRRGRNGGRDTAAGAEMQQGAGLEEAGPRPRHWGNCRGLAK